MISCVRGSNARRRSVVDRSTPSVSNTAARSMCVATWRVLPKRRQPGLGSTRLSPESQPRFRFKPGTLGGTPYTIYAARYNTPCLFVEMMSSKSVRYVRSGLLRWALYPKKMHSEMRVWPTRCGVALAIVCFRLDADAETGASTPVFRLQRSAS